MQYVVLSYWSGLYVKTRHTKNEIYHFPHVYTVGKDEAVKRDAKEKQVIYCQVR